MTGGDASSVARALETSEPSEADSGQGRGHDGTTGERRGVEGVRMDGTPQDERAAALQKAGRHWFAGGFVDERRSKVPKRRTDAELDALQDELVASAGQWTLYSRHSTKGAARQRMHQLRKSARWEQDREWEVGVVRGPVPEDAIEEDAAGVYVRWVGAENQL